MRTITARWLLVWIAGNAAAAAGFPLLFRWWLRSMAAGDPAPADAGTLPIVVAAFTAAWLLFIVGLNITLAVFLWLRQPGPRSRDRAIERSREP